MEKKKSCGLATPLSRVASLLSPMCRAKLLAPSPASTLSSTNLHLIIFVQLVQAGFFVSFATDKSLCVHESSGAVGFDLRDSFPLSFSSVLFSSSSSFFSHSASGFSLPLSCSYSILCVPPQPPQKRCKLSQALICQLQLHARSSSLDSIYFQHLSTPRWKHFCLFGLFSRRPCFSELVIGISSLHPPPPKTPPLYRLLLTLFFATDGRNTLRAAISNQPLRARLDL
ncbi:hypothetical protein GGI43DRAFT_126840 [Trichoderma evansii]